MDRIEQISEKHRAILSENTAVDRTDEDVRAEIEHTIRMARLSGDVDPKLLAKVSRGSGNAPVRDTVDVTKVTVQPEQDYREMRANLPA